MNSSTNTADMNLHDLLEDWAQHKHLYNQEDRDQSDNYKESKRAIDTFVELNDEKPVSQYQRNDLLAFKTHYHQKGLVTKTIVKYVGSLKKIIHHGVKNELIEKDPFPAGAYEVTQDKTQSNESKVRPYKLDELSKIFSAPLYTGIKSSSRRHDRGDIIIKDHKYWLPLIGLFSGMRETEIIQLATDDITEEDGIYYFRITDAKPYQKLKTPQSKRSLPIHEELIKAGLLEYHKEKLKAGCIQLFPEVEANNKEKRLAKSFSQFFGRFCDRIKLTDKETNFHSFRHTFKDACREARIERDLHDRLTGHGDPTVSGSYGSGFSIPVLAKELFKIKYKDTKRDLDLSHLHTEQGMKDWKALEALYIDLNVSIDKDTVQASKELSEPKKKPKLSDYTIPLSQAYQTIGKAIYGEAWIPESKMIGTRGEPEPADLSRVDYQWYMENRKYNPEKHLVDSEDHIKEMEYLDSYYTVSKKLHSEQFNTAMKALFEAMYDNTLGYAGAREFDHAWCGRAKWTK